MKKSYLFKSIIAMILIVVLVIPSYAAVVPGSTVAPNAMPYTKVLEEQEKIVSGYGSCWITIELGVVLDAQILDENYQEKFIEIDYVDVYREGTATNLDDIDFYDITTSVDTANREITVSFECVATFISYNHEDIVYEDVEVVFNY